MPLLTTGAGKYAAAAGATYQGPGDIIASDWVFWGGLRAFKASTRGNACCEVTKTVGAVPLDIPTDATTGILDMTVLNGHLSGGAGTVTKLYDQSGNGRHMLNAGAPPIAIVTFGSSPVAMGVGALIHSSISATYPLPLTYVGVAQRAVGASFGRIIAINATYGIGFGADDNAFLYAGSFVIEASPEGSLHAVIGVLPSGGTNSVLNVDGVDGTPTSGGANGITSGDTITFPISVICEYSLEAGILSIDLDGTQRSNFATNMKTYYGIT